MKLLFALIAAFGFLVVATHAVASTEAEDVAVRGLEAMNRNQGQKFVLLAHSKVIQKFRDVMIERFEAAARGGTSLGALKQFGVTTVEELKALDSKMVASVMVDHMSDSEPAKVRELMHIARFTVVSSKPIDAGTVEVTISVDVGDGRSKPVQVLSKLEEEKWKYWGFPELVKR